MKRAVAANETTIAGRDSPGGICCSRDDWRLGNSANVLAATSNVLGVISMRKVTRRPHSYDLFAGCCHTPGERYSRRRQSCHVVRDWRWAFHFHRLVEYLLACD